MKLDTLTFSTEEKRTLFDGKKVSAVTDIDYSHTTTMVILRQMISAHSD